MQKFQSLGLRPLTPVGLRRLGAQPSDPQDSPPLQISGYAPAFANVNPLFSALIYGS